MAAYGALVSVMQIMDQIHHHPHPPISIDEKQSESLAANVTFLQEFLEGYKPHVSYTSETDPLESRIAEAAYAAEDVIESYIVDQINLARSTDHVEEISSTEFYQGVQKVIEEMDLIKMEIEDKMKDKKKMGVQIIKKKSTISDAAGPFQSSSTAQKVTTMVGFDDVLYEMLDKITGGGVDRQILPIVGMGGLGKTTLARNIYINPLVKEHFDICAWSTISQEYNTRKILSEILGQVGEENGGDLSEYELGEQLYKYLIGRRYFVVMDDMWSIEAWDVVRSFFPENENGSRVVVTTRLSNLASKFNYSDGLDMKFLDDASCWNLFCKTAFGEEICPPELEKIGKKIVKGCRGLPLSIVVVGGLLSKSEATRENWELIEEILSSVVNLEGDGSCLQILYVSYNNLPVHLKPCFLYVGVFPEDEGIPVFFVVPLLVAEGIIKPFEGKSLEQVAEDCIQELVDRNLILVEERDDCGKLKSLKMHDLLRDLALREGKKDTFLCAPVLMQSSDHWEISHGAMSTQRRIATSFDDEYPLSALLESEKPTSSSVVRSLIGEFPETFSISNFRLLRVCMVNSDSIEEESSDEQYEEILIRLANLRLIAVDVEELPLPRICSWAPFLWNLQTLYLDNVGGDCVLDIWKMPLLRHVRTMDGELCVPYRSISCDDTDEVVFENLQTLFTVRNLNLSEEVLKRIPNIKKLKLVYDEKLGDCRLHKLQELRLGIYRIFRVMMVEVTLPYSLKKLTLYNTNLPCEDMKTKIGPLPLLQVLKLKDNAFIGSEWETFEGQFSSLKFLLIKRCDLEHWTTDNTHFPRLECLVLCRLFMLREIPSSIRDIPTLRSITVDYCSDYAESAQRIREEQEEYGNEVLQIQVERNY